MTCMEKLKKCLILMYKPEQEAVGTWISPPASENKIRLRIKALSWHTVLWFTVLKDTLYHMCQWFDTTRDSLASHWVRQELVCDLRPEQKDTRSHLCHRALLWGGGLLFSIRDLFSASELKQCKWKTGQGGLWWCFNSCQQIKLHTVRDLWSIDQLIYL